MCIYSIVNVENIKLNEPSTLDYEINQVSPTIEYLALGPHVELAEYIFCRRNLEQLHGNYMNSSRLGCNDNFWKNINGTLRRR